MLTVDSSFSPFETKKRTRLMRAERETEKNIKGEKERKREEERERVDFTTLTTF